jgi:hypothetical protein
MAIGAVCQCVGTICIVLVVAIVAGCNQHEERSRPSGDATVGASCGPYAAGQPCTTEHNLAQCRELLDSGCQVHDLLAMESCPLQFACAPPPPPPLVALEDCGPVGTCGAHANCRGACDQEVCASVRCVCADGYVGDGYSCVPAGEDEGTSTLIVPGPPATAVPPPPRPPPPTVDIDDDGGGGFCQEYVRAGDWLITKILGVFGGVLLLAATPLLACQSDGCAGCQQCTRRGGTVQQVEQPPRQLQERCSNAVAMSWVVYAMAAASFVLMGCLGLGFHVAIPMAFPVLGVLLFDAACVLMCCGRSRRSGFATATGGGGGGGRRRNVHGGGGALEGEIPLVAMATVAAGFGEPGHYTGSSEQGEESAAMPTVVKASEVLPQKP